MVPICDPFTARWILNDWTPRKSPRMNFLVNSVQVCLAYSVSFWNFLCNVFKLWLPFSLYRDYLPVTFLVKLINGLCKVKTWYTEEGLSASSPGMASVRQMPHIPFCTFGEGRFLLLSILPDKWHMLTVFIWPKWVRKTKPPHKKEKGPWNSSELSI